jgi:tetratricopeptide (TPR) repeat protein
MASDIVFKESTTGKVLTRKDLQGFSGTASWEIVSEKTVSNIAMEYHQKGRQYGQQGDYEKSLEFLAKASVADPKWAYPIYDMAYTYMLVNNYDKAYELYQKVNAMEPRGFFTTKTAVYTLKGEKEGAFPKGLYMAYLSLEWMDPEKKAEKITNLVNNLPNYAPGWKEAIALAGTDEAALSIIENGLKVNPDKETYGILMINKALILHRNSKKQEALNILGKLAMDKESSMGTEKMAKQTLSHLLEGE